MSLVATASSKEPSMMIPSTGDEGLLFEFVDDEEEDLCISIDCLRSASTKHLNPLFSNTDHQIISPRRSVADKEISVDPISIKQSVLSTVKTTGKGGEYVVTRNSSFAKPPDVAKDVLSFNPSMMKPPASPGAISRIDSANCKYPPPVPPPAISPSKSINRFLSCSLPNSPSSSHRCGPPSLMKNIKKWRHNQNHVPHPPPLPPAINYLRRQRSVAVSPFASDDSASYIARSKSVGEGRRSAPSVDFDIWSKKVNEHRNEQQSSLEDDDTNSNMADYCEDFEEDDIIKTIRRIRSKKGKAASGNYRYGDDEVKCGSLSCLYLPGFGKGKQVRPRKQNEEDYSHHGQEAEEVQHQQAPITPKLLQHVSIPRTVSTQHVIISRTVSLEKFECGSWSSAGMINDDRDEAGSSHYYDLPLELIRNSANDADGPVNTAFVFEREIKGVLKNSSSSRDQPRLSQDSPSTRHVRFSTSSSNAPSTCITPRLRKAREDFNALLEAQQGM